MGRRCTEHVLERLRTCEVAVAPLGPLSLAGHAGEVSQPSSHTIRTGGTRIGRVALGYLFLDDECQRHM
jgi:hypothetical protein